jgi:hypothetical protein
VGRLSTLQQIATTQAVSRHTRDEIRIRFSRVSSIDREKDLPALGAWAFGASKPWGLSSFTNQLHTAIVVLVLLLTNFD